MKIIQALQLKDKLIRLLAAGFVFFLDNMSPFLHQHATSQLQGLKNPKFIFTRITWEPCKTVPSGSIDILYVAHVRKQT